MNFSVRYVFLGFLALVALCAVFFSLGYVVGYNERASNPPLVAEHVAPPTENVPALPPPGSRSAATSSSEARQAGTKEEAAQAQSSSPSADTGVPASSAPAFSKPPGPASTAAGAGITIQVAASHARQDAEALARILKGRGYPVFIVTPEDARAGDSLFRVQVGPYPSREDAEKVRQKLVDEGFRPFIKRP